jgi:diketogulonate reductase-like aldo/keto reductase
MGVMQKYITLNDGNKIPTLGLGTWQSEKNQVAHAVRYAITEAQYRHIDCALIYQNEKEIGEVFGEVINKTVKREELFVTSKLWNTHHHPDYVEKACKKTLSDLRLDYLDLYLIHWGIAFKSGDDLRPADSSGKPILDKISIQQTWKAMESLVRKGLVKSIGVANFTVPMLVDLLTYATVKPVTNQVELHPYNAQPLLLDYCASQDIAVTAYSPLGRPGAADVSGPSLLEEVSVKNLAAKYKKTPAQILLNWAVSRGTIAIPKSVKPERVKENADIFDFEITESEQKEISSLNRNLRLVDPIDWWGIAYFA